MNLRSLQRQWHAWGLRDPMWAAVTHAGKEGRRWDAGEFMRSGDDEIESVLERLAALGAAPARGRALDFGCALGRHTQALARRFGRADGVDIAPSMVAQARALNRAPNCSYHLNQRQDLGLFADGSFDFVWSILVLQHMRPDYAAGYLREMLRVLAAGGALVVQVPCAVSLAAPEPAGPRTVGSGPLPAEGFRAALVPAVEGLEMLVGAIGSIAVRVENSSPQAWPALGGEWGRHRVQLGQRWLRSDGSPVPGNEGRAALPWDLGPGQAVDLELWFNAPGRAGSYVLELDMVQEDVAWFRERGGAPVHVPCRIEGGEEAVEPSGQRAGTRFAGFRRRHPLLHSALACVGLVQARRALTRARARFGEWRRRRRRPAMEMHALGAEEVARIVAAGGGRILQAPTTRWPRGVVSCQYWVVKDGGPDRPGPAGAAR